MVVAKDKVSGRYDVGMSREDWNEYCTILNDLPIEEAILVCIDDFCENCPCALPCQDYRTTPIVGKDNRLHYVDCILKDDPLYYESCNDWPDCAKEICCCICIEDVDRKGRASSEDIRATCPYVTDCAGGVSCTVCQHRSLV